jgi:hypothetical protein
VVVPAETPAACWWLVLVRVVAVAIHHAVAHAIHAAVHAVHAAHAHAHWTHWAHSHSAHAHPTNTYTYTAHARGGHGGVPRAVAWAAMARELAVVA